MLTRSPATIPWPTAPMVTAASPVRTPARACDGRPEAAHGGHQLEGGADGSLGVVLVAGRGAPDGHDGVADELLDRAAVPLDDAARQLEVARQELAHLLGVAVLGQGGEADQVGEQDGDQAALGDGCRPDAPATGALPAGSLERHRA